MQTPAPSAPAAPARLLQLRSDRRLGHEWDDWDGEPLPGDGVHHEGSGLFFRLAAAGGGIVLGAGGAALWLVAPRLGELWAPLPGVLGAGIAAAGLLLALWLGALARALRTGRNRLPPALAEAGALPRAFPWLERLGVRLGVSRDRVGNSLMRVHNALTAARARPGVRPDDLLVLLPRCLGKEAMQGAMDVAGRYGVPLFVASRGRYAREMIALRRPKRVVAVACERDLASGVHDVGPRLPVLGVTLALPDGPCRNTGVEVAALEGAVRRFLGLDGAADAP
ncbi:MAG TPA: DUF116 domain-containing protein [Longimicrobiaceae bacterium]